MQRKQQEMESYFTLLSNFSDYEKLCLLEHTDKDDSKLVFFNAKNNDICLQMVNLKDSVQNPYIKMFDWLEEEEFDVEAINESINSLNNLAKEKDKLIIKRNAICNEINEVNAGKKGIKNLFKSKKDTATELENQKKFLETQITSIEIVMRIATWNMERVLNVIKGEKLTSYYQNLKLCAEIQKDNSINMLNFWSIISQDKNVNAISNTIRIGTTNK